MKTEREPLLDAILHEGDGFREELWARTLRQVRNKNRVRQCKRAAALLLAVATLPLFLWHPAKVSRSPEVARVHRAYEVVSSQPLRDSLLVQTQPNRFSVAPVPSVHLVTITSIHADSASRVTIVPREAAYLGSIPS